MPLKYKRSKVSHLATYPLFPVFRVAVARREVGRAIYLYWFLTETSGFPVGLDGKASAHNEGNLDSIPGSGRSPGEGNAIYPLQYSCLENPMERGASWATVHGVAECQTQLRNFIFFSGRG